MDYLGWGVNYVNSCMAAILGWLAEVFTVIDGFKTLILVCFCMLLSVRFFLMPIVGNLGLPAGPGLGSGSDGVRRDRHDIDDTQRRLGSGK